MMFWLVLNWWTAFRLLNTKDKNLKRTWRRQDMFTYTAKNEEDAFSEDVNKNFR